MIDSISASSSAMSLKPFELGFTRSVFPKSCVQRLGSLMLTTMTHDQLQGTASHPLFAPVAMRRSKETSGSVWATAEFFCILCSLPIQMKLTDGSKYVEYRPWCN